MPDKLVAWAENRGKRLRGHCLLWSKEENNPDWVQQLYGEQLVAAMTNRVATALDHFSSGQVLHWDVVNEMVDAGNERHDFNFNHTGDPLIRWPAWLGDGYHLNLLFLGSKCSCLPKACRQKLSFSSMTTESSQTGKYLSCSLLLVNCRQGKFGLCQQQIRDLLAQGAPIDGIGKRSFSSIRRALAFFQVFSATWTRNWWMCSSKESGSTSIKQVLTLQDKRTSWFAVGGIQDSNLGDRVQLEQRRGYESTQILLVFNQNSSFLQTFPWGDHSLQAAQLSKFYRLMFSHEVNRRLSSV